MKWALVDTNGVILNIIEYDGESDYDAPDGESLAQVDDSLSIGDNINPNTVAGSDGDLDPDPDTE